MSIFGKRRDRHPLEPIQEPIRLGGGRAVHGFTGPADAIKPSDTAVPTRPADMPPNWNPKPRAFAPHCDQRILHAPSECWACDLYPDWQALRVKWGIAFTGHQPDIRIGEVECPADYNRPPGSKSDHRHWGPNQAQGDRHG